MNECELCGSFGGIIDAVFEARPVEVCRGCATLHNAIILEKPSIEKIKDVERIFSVRERLEEASKVREREKQKRIEEAEKKTAFPETLSYKLRKERERSGLSREKLADELGSTAEQVEKIEAGETPYPNILKRYEQFFKKKFEIEEEKEVPEEEKEISFKDTKLTLRELMERAKSLFTGRKSGEVERGEESEGKVLEAKEIGDDKDEIKIY